MSYKIVNEELRIQSCNIEDLSEETKKLFVEQFEDAPIEILTLFYNPVTDIVILNRDNKGYELYEFAAVTYLEGDSELRAAMKEQAKGILDSTIELLEKVVSRREQLKIDKEAEKLIRLLGKQSMNIYINNIEMLEAFRRINKKANNSFLAYYNTFMYGYIQGIRSERARKKRVDKTNKNIC